MRKRLKVDGNANLVDRDGAVVGRIEGLTLVIDCAAGAVAEGEVRGEDAVHPSVAIGANAQETLLPEGVVGGDSTDEVALVWAHYQRVIPGGSRYRLDPKRRTIIKNALKVRDIGTVTRAIDGLAVSPFHNGENDRAKKYLSIRYALQGIGAESNDERIDKMAALAYQHRHDPLSHVPSGAREMVRTRQRQVEDMLLNPGDRTLLARGEGAVTYLQETWGLRAFVADDDGNVTWVVEVGGGQ